MVNSNKTTDMQTAQNKGLCINDMDTTVSPGFDFQKFATGHWIDNNPALPDYPDWDIFTMLHDKTTIQISDLIRKISSEQHEEGSLAQKVADLYSIYMDTERLEKEGYSPIIPFLKQIDSCQDNQELIDLMAKNHDNIFFDGGIGSDPKDSSKYIVFFIQGINNPDNYLSQDPNIRHMAEIRHEHRVNLLRLVGESQESAEHIADLYTHTYTALAPHCFSLVEQRDPELTYNMMTIAEMQAKTPTFDWNRYLQNYGYDNTTEANFTCPNAIIKACQMFMELPLETLKAIYKIDVIWSAAGKLSKAFRDEVHDFSVKMYGPSEEPERWKKAVGFIKSTMGDVVSQLYVGEYFPEENKEKALALVSLLKDSFADRIKAQEWMSVETKEAALDKLKAMKVKIGYPDKWDDISGLTVDPSLSLWENYVTIKDFYWWFYKNKYYNKTVDKTAWFIAPTSVNAMYNSADNDITFPAAILQAPFFDMDADDAVNLGAIGSIIGHEMTHGFDDEGKKFDKDGNLNQWWSEEDEKKFNSIAVRMSDFHNRMEALPGLACNGKLTLGEDIADRGGISIALNALKKLNEKSPQETIDGFTPIQRFFLSYARNWAGYMPEEQIKHQTINDVHSISRIRVNSAVSMFEEWHEAFDIKPDDPLYLAKEDRIEIW